jgi:hypothetical protein
MNFTVKTIGRAVRLPHWSSCMIEVGDVGLYTFWGRLMDVKTNMKIMTPDGLFVGHLSEPWELVLEARDLIGAE